MAVQLTKVKFAINAIPTYSPKHRFRDVLYSMADALKVKDPLSITALLMQIMELIGFYLPF
jgi:hypothetical protein